MFSFLTDLELYLISSSASFVLGVIFSTKITDWFKGVPTTLRAALNSVEKDTVVKVKAAQAAVVASLPTASPAKLALPPMLSAVENKVKTALEPAAVIAKIENEVKTALAPTLAPAPISPAAPVGPQTA